MIRVLPEDVRCHLRSGVAVTSVAQCVEELLLNSADAQATCIAVRVDLETFKVQVVDNGCGLCPEDMERVGIRYFTSKCHSVKDLENLRFYGFRGEAIASMVAASGVVEICSRHKDSSQTFSRLFQNGKPLDVAEAETPRPTAGTTVTLYSLFSNLPVRRKHLDPVLELERIRQRVEAVSLVKPSVSFSLRNDVARCVLLQLPKTKDPCSRFCQIFGLSRSQSLREVQHTHCNFTMGGLISCEGHYNKAMQFLYVNHRLVLRTKLHKLIDFIIRRESAICRGRGGRPRSTADLHGIFVVNIRCHASEYDICFQPDKTLIEFQDWDKVMLCTEQGLRSFLKRENLFLEPSKDDIDEFSQKHHYHLLCEGGDQLESPQGPGGGTVHPSDVTAAGSPPPPSGAQKEYDQLPGDVPETHINSRDIAYIQEGRTVCDMQELADNGSPLTPPDTAGVSSALSCAESGALNEKTTSSVPRNPAGSEHVGRGISNSAAFGVTQRHEEERCSTGPTPIQLSTAATLGGTLDRFRRQYGKSCPVSRDCRKPQLPKGPRKTEAAHLDRCAGTDIPTSANTRKNQPHKSTAPTTNPKQKPSTVTDDAECPPTLTTKLCRLKNMGCASSDEGCKVTPSTPPSSNISKDGGAQAPREQQAALNEGGQTRENSPAEPMSHEWLQCYEESLGKNVFINTATGLSSYSAPARDKPAVCTKDLSNMAVNVVCSNGRYKYGVWMV